MLSTLDRYIVRSFLVNYGIAVSVLIAMYVVLDLFVNFDEFTEAGLPAAQVIRNLGSYYGYNLFLYFSQIAGVITLFAAACTLARMRRSNELTAVLASGTSLYRVAVPVLISGILMNLLLIADQEWIIPRIAHKLARTHDDVEGRRTRDVWLVPDRNGARLSAIRFNHNQQLITRLIITRDQPRTGLTEIIRADRAHYAGADGRWELDRGTRLRRSGDGDAMAVGGMPEAVDVYESDLTPDDLLLRQSSQWITLLNMRELDRLAGQPGQRIEPILQVKHKRFTLPFVNMLLLLLGVPFFLNREPSNVLVSGGLCMLICGLCFVTAFVSQNLIDYPAYPALPAWLPILIFGPVAVLFLDSVKT
jgi:lipopolysaccharide export system permease protein